MRGSEILFQFPLPLRICIRRPGRGGQGRGGINGFYYDNAKGCNLTQRGDKLQASRGNTDTGGYKGVRDKWLATLAAKNSRGDEPPPPEIRNNGIPLRELQFGVKPRDELNHVRSDEGEELKSAVVAEGAETLADAEREIRGD